MRDLKSGIWMMAIVSGAIALAGCSKEEEAPAEAPAAEPAPAEPAAIACTNHAKDLPGLTGTAEVTCLCAADAGKGSLWGSGTYTTDSDICKAAVHAGLIKTGTGGKVTVQSAPGCSAYEGTEANGIKSSKWNSYPGSFVFPEKGAAKCYERPEGLCTDNFKQVPNQTDGMEVECECPASPTGGSVYGTDMYTTDSNICRAALHAGAITAAGGKIKVKKAPGCPKYTGTSANGVTTTAWNSYPESYYFPEKGDGKCAN